VRKRTSKTAKRPKPVKAVSLLRVAIEIEIAMRIVQKDVAQKRLEKDDRRLFELSIALKRKRIESKRERQDCSSALPTMPVTASVWIG